MRRLVFALLASLAASPSLSQTVTAVLEPARAVELRSTVNGRVTEIVRLEGTRVAAGDVVAEIDAAVQRARVALARVTVEADGTRVRAQKLLAQAEFRRDRMAAARAKQAAQAWEVDLAEQAVAVARADLKVAEDELARRAAELALEQATLAEFSVRAPFDATVLHVQVDTGEIVDTATVLVELGSLDTLLATAFVPVDWALKWPDTSEQLSASLESGAAVDASVKAVDPRVDPASRTVRVLIEVPNTDNQLRPGEILVIEDPR